MHSRLGVRIELSSNQMNQWNTNDSASELGRYVPVIKQPSQSNFAIFVINC